jgi:hypothetical protein
MNRLQRATTPLGTPADGRSRGGEGRNGESERYGMKTHWMGMGETIREKRGSTVVSAEVSDG